MHASGFGFPEHRSCGQGQVNGVWLKRCVSQRFIDQGETVIDRTTGLQWEKKTDDGGVHDKDNLYTWTGNANREQGPWNFDGTAYTQFIERLNAPGACYAGHCDWRLPTIDELKGIIDTRREGCPAVLGCIDPALGLTPSVPTESYIGPRQVSAKSLGLHLIAVALVVWVTTGRILSITPVPSVTAIDSCIT